MRIEPITIAAYSRKSSVTASEAILFLLDQSKSGLKAFDLLEKLTSRFVPPFPEREIKEATARMLDEGVVHLSPDRYLTRRH